MEVQMQNSLPARPSLEQLKKLAKDLVKSHGKKEVAALDVISRFLPVLSGKSNEEIAAYPFALHDAQSVIARQHGLVNWNELVASVEPSRNGGTAPQPPELVADRLRVVFEARGKMDYSLWCSVMSEEMKAFVTKERFEATSDRLSGYFKSDHHLTYMGSLNRGGRPIHFWRLWVEGWESDILVRMSLNQAGWVAGLLFSDPFDTAINAKR